MLHILTKQFRRVRTAIILSIVFFLLIAIVSTILVAIFDIDVLERIMTEVGMAIVFGVAYLISPMVLRYFEEW